HSQQTAISLCSRHENLLAKLVAGTSKTMTQRINVIRPVPRCGPPAVALIGNQGFLGARSPPASKRKVSWMEGILPIGLCARNMTVAPCGGPAGRELAGLAHRSPQGFGV